MERLKAANERRGVGADEAEYLQNYLALCDTAISQKWDREEAEKAITELNESYKLRVAPSVLRETVATVDAREKALEEADSWASSRGTC